MHVLWRRKVKQFEGRVVREAMRHDVTAFKALVPKGVFDTIIEDQILTLYSKIEECNAPIVP